MAYKTYVTQRTNRHVVKRIDSATNAVDASFGEFGVLGTDNNHLNYPTGLIADASDNIYVANTLNEKITVLSSSLTFTSTLDVSAIVGKPVLMYFDSPNLVVVGKKVATYFISKITVAGVEVYTQEIGTYPTVPTGIIKVNSTDFAITGLGLDLDVWQDTGSGFTGLGNQAITGEDPKIYTGIASDGSNFILNDGSKLIKINSTFENIGGSNRIARPTFLSTVGDTNTILVYDKETQKVKRYSNNLNFIEDVFEDTGDTMSDDAKEIEGLIEIDV